MDDFNKARFFRREKAVLICLDGFKGCVRPVRFWLSESLFTGSCHRVLHYHPFYPCMVLGYLSYIPIGFALFCMFSRNIYKRQAENQKFLQISAPVIKWFRTKSARAKDSAHKYYACPKCKQTCRVPSGKGKIQITCPKCGEKFIKKT